MYTDPVNRGKNLYDIQANNRSLILKLLKRRKICSRTELAEASGLKNATITHIIDEFMSYGLVEERGNIAGKKGRRSVAVALNSDKYAVIGVVISRLFALIGLYDLCGNLVDERIVSFKKSKDIKNSIELTKSGTAVLIQNNPNCKVLAIGIGVPGPYFRETGRSSYIMGYPEWDDVFIGDEFEETFSLPVIVEHDANLGALSEWEDRMGDDQENTLVYLAFSQGIGAGIIQNGQIFRGGFGTAGEIGHISVDYNGERCTCGNRGCATVQASTIRFMELVKQRIQNGETSSLNGEFHFEDLISAVKRKDKVAYSEYQKLIPYLGRTVINAIWAYSPKEIVIGAELALLGERLIIDLKEYVHNHMDSLISDRVNIQLNSADCKETLKGAGLIAIDYVFNHIKIFSD